MRLTDRRSGPCERSTSCGGLVGPARELGDQPVARGLDRVLETAHEGLLVQPGLDRRQEFDGGAAGVLAPVAAVPQQADRVGDGRHRQAEIARQVVDARAIALALARRHQVAFRIDRDVPAAVIGALGELGEILALLAAAAGVDADHLQPVEDGADHRHAEQLLHGDEGDAGDLGREQDAVDFGLVLAGEQCRALARAGVRGRAPRPSCRRSSACPTTTARA